MAPSLNLGLGNLPPERLKCASGLLNMMRNLVGAVGIGVSPAIINDETNLHFQHSGSHLTPANLAMERLVQGITERYATLPAGSTVGRRAAFERLWQLAYRKASTLAFADAFRAIMVVFVVATLLVPFLRQVAAPKAPVSNAHSAAPAREARLLGLN